VKITLEEVRRVAMLARLALTPAEEERLTEELDKILRYVEKLSELDTSQVEPFTHGVTTINAFRNDEVTTHTDSAAVLANAPEKDQTFFKVPKIIE
jgi:aspartyl-tRNA(Asn)/glutamyl-tRNA(Gln) amidotransferase subunit C